MGMLIIKYMWKGHLLMHGWMMNEMPPNAILRPFWFKWHMDKCSKWHIVKTISTLQINSKNITSLRSLKMGIQRDSAQIEVTHNKNNMSLIDKHNICYIFKIGIECCQEIVHGNKGTFLVNWSLHMYRAIIHKKGKGHEHMFPLMHEEALEDKKVMKRDKNVKRARVHICFTCNQECSKWGAKWINR